MRIVHDALNDLGVRNAEPHLLGDLVDPGPRDHLAEHLAVETKGIGLFRRDGMAELLAELPQSVLVSLTELVGRNFRVADLGQIRMAEAAEDVVDAPQGETAGEKRQDDAHDGAAEPIGGGFPDTSKHTFPGSLNDDDLAARRSAAS